MADKMNKKKQETKKKTNFFAGLFAELKRVAWPDRMKWLQNCAAVLIIAVAFALLIWIVDTVVYTGLNLIGFHDANQSSKKSSAIPAVTSQLQPTQPNGSGANK